MNTLQLTPEWDITPNLTVLTGNAAITQDVASACRTWEGEAWYNTLLGVPYLPTIFARRPTLNAVKNLLISQAIQVPGVGSVTVYLTAGPGRVIGGQIQIKNSAGAIIGVVQAPNFGSPQPWWVGGASYSAVGATT